MNLKVDSNFEQPKMKLQVIFNSKESIIKLQVVSNFNRVHNEATSFFRAQMGHE